MCGINFQFQSIKEKLAILNRKGNKTYKNVGSLEQQDLGWAFRCGHTVCLACQTHCCLCDSQKLPSECSWEPGITMMSLQMWLRNHCVHCAFIPGGKKKKKKKVSQGLLCFFILMKLVPGQWGAGQQSPVSHDFA